MDFKTLEDRFKQAGILRDRVGRKDGISTRWSAHLDNGEIHYYTIGGVKPHEEVQLDVESMFVWLWSLKDYTKDLLKDRNMPYKWVESEIDADPYLSISADLANRSKHHTLRKSRSGKFPTFGVLNYKIPGQAASSICFTANHVGIMGKDPSQVILEMPILDNNDKVLGDAFKYMEYALSFWEATITKADRTTTHIET